VTNEVIDLSRRDVDVVIRDSARAPEHLVGRKAARLAIAAYATPSLLDRLGRRLPLGEYPWLAFDGGLSRLAEALRFAEHAASAKRRRASAENIFRRSCARRRPGPSRRLPPNVSAGHIAELRDSAGR